MNFIMKPSAKKSEKVKMMKLSIYDEDLLSQSLLLSDIMLSNH